MLRVMLVDDEPLALEGLSLLIDWKKEGFVVCASCDGGKQALDSICETKPHLIVTDIRMQDMDGLSLMAAARDRGYEGAFIIVSGYSDFEYAKKAMRIGVAGYLLKPIEPKEVSQVLEHVRKELIDKELKHKLPLAAYHQAVTALLSGQPFKQLPLPQGAWQLFTWGIPLAYDTVAMILEVFSDTGIQASTHIVDGKEWLVLFAKESLDMADINPMRQMLQANQRELAGSPVKDNAEHLNDLRCAICAQLDDCEAELVRRVQELSAAVSLLQHDAFDRMVSELNSFCDLRGNTVKAKAYELFLALCVSQLSEDSAKIGKLLSDPARDMKALGELAMRLLTPAPLRISDHVSDYLETHFKERLTLESVAASLSYNATYLGRVFREETGMGFRAYLNTLRIQKAAELIKGSTLSVHRAADEVGYLQYKQFLAHFKAYYGQTPKEYRQSISP